MGNKKKTKKLVVFLNMGKRFKGLVRRALDFEIPLNEDDNQEKDDESVKAKENKNLGSCQDSDEDYSIEQYPPADDRYKQLEDRLNVMEIQKVSGPDFEELDLILGVVIPHKFKVPTFAKYDGVSCPKLHLRSYVQKIQPHTAEITL